MKPLIYGEFVHYESHFEFLESEASSPTKNN